MDQAKYLCVAILALLSVNFAAAETLDEKLARALSDDAVRESIRLGLTRIDKAKCESNKPCARATAEESARPPISLQDGRAAWGMGFQFFFAGLQLNWSWAKPFPYTRYQQTLDFSQPFPVRFDPVEVKADGSRMDFYIVYDF